jgi:hypothetical protein
VCLLSSSRPTIFDWLQQSTSRGASAPASPVAAEPNIDLSAVSLPPLHEDVSTRVSIDVNSGELLSLESVLAALLCQRGRLLAIAHAHPQWCTKALKLPRGEVAPDTPDPNAAPTDTGALIGKQSLFDAAMSPRSRDAAPAPAPASVRGTSETSPRTGGRSVVRAAGSTRAHSSIASEEERHKCLGLAYMDVHDSLALMSHSPLAELYRCCDRLFADVYRSECVSLSGSVRSITRLYWWQLCALAPWV